MSHLNSVVRARIDQKTKEEAEVVLAAIGLTVSDAFRLLLIRIAQDKALPFTPLIPNAETIAAMKEARAGRMAGRDNRNVDELLSDLNENNQEDEEVHQGLQESQSGSSRRRA